MRRLLATLVAILIAGPALAEFKSPPVGTTFLYGVYEGGETPTITRTLTVVAADDTGYVASDPEGSLTLMAYGFAETACGQYGPFDAGGLAKALPFRAGTELVDGFYFVIGKDQPFFMDGVQYETWAVRGWTEHGSTWVTRTAPGLGAPVDDLVKIEKRSLPPHNAADAANCLADR